MKQLAKIFVICILVQIGGICYSQESGSKANVDSLITEGNKLLQKGAFGKALPVWLKVLKEDLDNANANFKVGLCYKHSFDKQTKALPYFKLASEKTSAKYNFYSKEEKAAPYDVWYFLGETYLALNKPDSAMKAFNHYKTMYKGNPPLDVEKQVQQCANARALAASPLSVKFSNVGAMVNTGYPETSPVVTIDNKQMFFSSRRLRSDESNKNWADDSNGKLPGDIYISKKDASGNWQLPVMFEYSSNLDEAPVFVTADGNTLYFRRKDNGAYNLYSSTFMDGVWQTPEPMSGINSHFNETGLSMTVDGKYLYFSSDREKGLGKMDIYMCEKKDGSKWGKPVNISRNINSPDNETLPFVQPNGNKLFFCSDNRNGMGGYDIYYSEKVDDNTWSAPVNLGYPINSTKDDLGYYVSSQGYRFCSSISDKLDYDLFQIEEGEFDAA
ncbi:MAG: hypothetical protein KJ607_08615, partial [Bacteroidetes bacterium]|nr:hypothetical protein [Bacteroidota bacterium]